MGISRSGFIAVFALLALLVAVCVPLLLGVFVYRDAKKRNMDAPFWTLLVLFIPGFIGLIPYFVMRGKAYTLCCPSCGMQVQRGFNRCPSCGCRLKNACPSCGRPVEHTWRICPDCGASLPENMAPVMQEDTRGLPAWLIVLIIVPFLLLAFGLVVGVTMFTISRTNCATTGVREDLLSACISDAPEERFIAEVLSLPEGEYPLRDLTPFDWDYALTFAPYTPKAEMESILGFSSPEVQETVNEGMVQLYFIRGSQIICALQGYAGNLGMGLDVSGARWQINENGAKYLRFECFDDTLFALVWEGEYPVLRYGG